MAARKVPAKLATARAYWRVAARFAKAGDYRQAEHYRSVGDRFHRGYLRDKEYIAKMEEGR
jgi:hypothetical protein